MVVWTLRDAISKFRNLNMYSKKIKDLDET
jgi:hypothetical protein